ncbi:hypothetical protein INT43_005122 [Umbelopsis isabellina]|uniref:C2H2-type domain-containing protein n=1 Tax=Mortierella isabellina TaxID=91625 RepID=A0A8H7PGS9_MORIS|nr:hypothetical protein INT43_005122 [Umbelopsis isabellina]
MSMYDDQNNELMDHKLPSISLLPQLDNQDDYASKNESKAATLSHTSPQECLKPSMSTSSNNSESSQGHAIPTPSSFLPPPYIPKDQNQNINCSYSNVVSPPLTPAVSPSSMLYDAMQMKRKYSVDVGPFAFSSSMVNHASVAASAFNTDMYQEAYRRHSMCSEMSLDDYTHHNAHSFAMPAPSPQPMGESSRGRRESTSGRANSKPIQSSAHKHVCKYPYCGWSFKRYEHLKRHMLVHTGERPHLCDFPGCGKSFSRSDNFAAHYRTHTKKTLLQHRNSVPNIETMHQSNAFFRQNKMPPNFDFARPYELYNDRQGFPSEQMQTTPEMIQHQQYLRSFETLQAIDTNQNTFQTTPLAKMDYMHMHQPSSPSSPTAPSALSSSLQNPISDVYIPMNVMSTPHQQKVHACQECRKRFKRLEHLKRHMRTHTLERPFSCPVPGCGKAFSRSDNLSQHVKTHQRHQYRERNAAAQVAAVNNNVWENSTTVDC